MVPINWLESPLVDHQQQPVRDPIGGDTLTVADWRAKQQSQPDTINDIIGAHGLPAVRCGKNHLLPLDYDSAEHVHIAVVGTVASSKSTYIAALLQALTTGASKLVSASTPRLPSGGRPIERARLSVFHERAQLAASSLDDQLVVIDLDIEGRATPLRLSFVDSSGEHFRDPDRSIKASFLASVDGVLLLVDPSNLPGLQRRRQSTGGAEPPHVILQNYLDAVEARRPGSERRCDIPLAVVVSKSDELNAYASYGVQTYLHRPELPPDGLLSVAQQDDESSDVWEFLDAQTDDSQLLELVKRFSHRTLHFASATGCAVDPSSRKYAYRPRPYRVLPPLFAVLAANDLLPAHLLVDRTDDGRTA